MRLLSVKAFEGGFCGCAAWIIVSRGYDEGPLETNRFSWCTGTNLKGALNSSLLN
jgi:hypothetical protein